MKRYSKIIMLAIVILVVSFGIMGAVSSNKKASKDKKKKEIASYFKQSYGQSPTNYIVTPDMHERTNRFFVTTQDKKKYINTFLKYFDIKHKLDFAMAIRFFIVKKGMIACNTPQGLANAFNVLSSTGGVYHTYYSRGYFVSPIKEAPGCVTNYMPNLVLIRRFKKFKGVELAQINFVAFDNSFHWHRNTGWIAMKPIKDGSMKTYDYIKASDFGLNNPYKDELKKMK